MDQDLGLDNAHCEFKIMGTNWWEERSFYTHQWESDVFSENFSQLKKDGENKPRGVF